MRGLGAPLGKERETVTGYIHTPLRKLPEDEQPREKIEHYGPESLSVAELVGLLLGSGTAFHTAVDLGRKLLKEFGGLEGLARADMNDLREVPGIGKAKASSLLAAFELGRRKSQTDLKQRVLKSSNAFAAYLRPKMKDKKFEEFRVIYLNKSCHLLGERVVGKGGATSVSVDPKIVLKEALKFNATCMVLSHNHPSGNPTPSREDHALTLRVVHAADLLDCKVLDHIIIAREKHYSYSDSGMMDYIRQNMFYQALKA